jgi:flavorubredoxin
MTASLEMPSGAEIVPDQLYVFGANVPLDARTSWCPPGFVGHQSMNCYVLRAGAEAMLVDPGPRVIEGDVVAGAAAALHGVATVPVFLTRYQLDGIGNLAALARTVPIGTVYSGGVSNPFDAFDQVTSAGDAPDTLRLGVQRTRPGGSIAIGGGRSFEIIAPLLRILTTFWGYDDGTKTLFTSDTFTHAVVRDAAAPRVVDSTTADSTSVADVSAHLRAIFHWLPHADIEPILDSVERIFAEHDVEVIAPSRGRVLRGRDVVERHYALLLDALKGLAEAR